ncbi:MAG TPA: hypothetical protein VIM11_12875 [Tepidisphaeraceae bacterium]|jgi:hypothetical protein
MAILMLFFYIDAVVLLVGAEINSEMDFALGVPRGSTDFRTLPVNEDENGPRIDTNKHREFRARANEPNCAAVFPAFGEKSGTTQTVNHTRVVN